MPLPDRAGAAAYLHLSDTALRKSEGAIRLIRGIRGGFYWPPIPRRNGAATNKIKPSRSPRALSAFAVKLSPNSPPRREERKRAAKTFPEKSKKFPELYYE